MIDPSVVEKKLSLWVSAPVAARGQDYYREGRVLSAEMSEQGRLRARVQGSRKEPYRVDLVFDETDWPKNECDCPFDWEPLCKHAVAALLEWAAPSVEEKEDEWSVAPQESSTERVPNQYRLEVERVERAARYSSAKDSKMKIQRRPPRSLLGEYRVVSRGGVSPYRVTVRDAFWENVSCTCLDFRLNELNVCKHIERVKRSLSAPSRLNRLKQEADQLREISLYVAPRPSHEGPFQPTGDIRLYIPPSLMGQTGSFQTGFVLNGCPPKKQAKVLARLVKSLKRVAPVRVEEAVETLLNREMESWDWEKKIEAIARDPKNHPAWKASLGALRIQLHPYQVEGILFAVRKRRAFLGDDMGLGKTVQGIGAALLLKELGVVKRAMVVCPTSLKFQWKREIERLCDQTVEIMEGAAPHRQRLYRESTAFFWVVNYEVIRRDFPALATAADFVILDEAQRIKNWQTQTAKTVKSLQAPHRLVLTGTPMENRLTELQSLAEFLDPRALGPAWKLIPTYARLDENLKIAGYQNLDHLRARLERFFLRRSRSEVLAQLPPRTDNLFWTPLDDRQRRVHSELEANVAGILAKWSRRKHLAPEDFRRLMVLLNSMRVVSNAYGQFDWTQMEREVFRSERMTPALWKKIGSPKLQEFPRVLGELLETAGQKVVVFSQWERLLRLAEFVSRDLTQEKEIRSVLFHGGLSPQERRIAVERFLDDPNTRVFFSTDAGSVGLNLQSAANCVINLESPWNPAVLEQRIGRVHRQGQPRSVEVVHLLSEGCIEQRIHQLVGQKKALFKGLFDGAVDIDFTAVQKASFLEKVQRLVSPEGSKVEAPASVPLPPALAVDSVADTVSLPATFPAPVGPSTDFDLTPVARAMARVFQLPEGRVPSLEPVRIHRTSEGLSVQIPASIERLFQKIREIF